ncbi:hypothetical protein [Pontibacter roseus]|uniref:hypothetical protein n=1 Tax=Pontibacter roseus TaxID=336989 RepID=UPI000373781E|nr:hypothetical protein [Pontibacter roseus]
MKKILLSVALAGALVLPSCQVANVALEPGFQQQAQELSVQGRKAFKPNGDFQVGDYQVGHVNRGWTRVGGFSLLGYENIKTSQQYEFSLQDAAGQQWYVFAASRLQEKNLQSDNGVALAVGKNLEYFASYFTSPLSGQWRLLTVDPGQYLMRKKFKGELSNGDEVFQVLPLYKTEASQLPSSDIIGYAFLRDGEQVAVVQVINNGKVWLGSELDEDSRMVLASAASSLLLYDKLHGKAEMAGL